METKHELFVAARDAHERYEAARQLHLAGTLPVDVLMGYKRAHERAQKVLRSHVKSIHSALEKALKVKYGNQAKAGKPIVGNDGQTNP